MTTTAKTLSEKIADADERGHSDGEVMTLNEAFAEYSAWHFGDRAWGYTFAHMANEFHKRA